MVIIGEECELDVVQFYLFSVDIRYGSCAPSTTCDTNLCDFISLQIMMQANVSFSSCQTHCCDGDLCNADAPTISTTGSAPSETATGRNSL